MRIQGYIINVINIIALNAPSMIEGKTLEELYEIACRGGMGSKIAVKRLKHIYPEHKMTDETIQIAVQELKGEGDCLKIWSNRILGCKCIRPWTTYCASLDELVINHLKPNLLL